MEQERHASFTRLVDRVRRDFPEASAVRVSFPDRWEHVETIQEADRRLYVAGFPIERAHPGRNHFEGLPAEINVDLVFYRLYKFFQPWPMPQVVVEWNQSQGEGRVIGDRGYKLQLQPVGQAQAWFGVSHAVLWEAYLDESRREENDPTRLASLWSIVEKDVSAPKLFTLPHEPAFHGDYPEFLKGLGYQPDAETQGWWSKDRATGEPTIGTRRTPLIKRK